MRINRNLRGIEQRLEGALQYDFPTADPESAAAFLLAGEKSSTYMCDLVGAIALRDMVAPASRYPHKTSLSVAKTALANPVVVRLEDGRTMTEFSLICANLAEERSPIRLDDMTQLLASYHLVVPSYPAAPSSE